jgi:uncharacterized membrane protein YjgN (DUF898 family)
MLPIMILFGIGMAVVVPLLMAGMGKGGSVGPGASMVAVMVLTTLAYLAVVTFVGSLIGARLQNLVWNHTRSDHLRFHSQLGVGALTRLSMKNWLLIVLTLGLYLPFAAVASAKLRLQALQLESDIHPDAWVSLASHTDESAAGDAAGDLFGIDIGL